MKKESSKSRPLFSSAAGTANAYIFIDAVARCCSPATERRQRLKRVAGARVRAGGEGARVITFLYTAVILIFLIGRFLKAFNDSQETYCLNFKSRATGERHTYTAERCFRMVGEGEGFSSKRKVNRVQKKKKILAQKDALRKADFHLSCGSTFCTRCSCLPDLFLL